MGDQRTQFKVVGKKEKGKPVDEEGYTFDEEIQLEEASQRRESSEEEPTQRDPFDSYAGENSTREDEWTEDMPSEDLTKRTPSMTKHNGSFFNKHKYPLLAFAVIGVFLAGYTAYTGSATKPLKPLAPVLVEGVDPYAATAPSAAPVVSQQAPVTVPEEAVLQDIQPTVLPAATGPSVKEMAAIVQQLASEIATLKTDVAQGRQSNEIMQNHVLQHGQRIEQSLVRIVASIESNKKENAALRRLVKARPAPSTKPAVAVTTPRPTAIANKPKSVASAPSKIKSKWVISAHTRTSVALVAVGGGSEYLVLQDKDKLPGCGQVSYTYTGSSPELLTTGCQTITRYDK